MDHKLEILYPSDDASHAVWTPCNVVLNITIDLVTFLMVILMHLKITHVVFWGNNDTRLDNDTHSNRQTRAKLTLWAWGARLEMLIVHAFQWTYCSQASPPDSRP